MRGRLHRRGRQQDRAAFSRPIGGTLFLDEIGEMPLALQVKILRALQERVVVRVGDTRAETIDIRVLAATNRDLEAEMKAGRFREDLYYRLNVVQLHLPPLRDRGDDIVVLARYMVGRYAPEYGGRVAGSRPTPSPPSSATAGPGNIRAAREPDQEGGRAGRSRAARPRGSRPFARRSAGHPAAGRRQGEVPARLHQRDPGAQQRQPHQDRPRSGGRPAHHLPPPRRRAKGARCSTTGPTPAAEREASERRARPERPCKFTAP